MKKNLVSKKGYITIPAKLRKKYEIKAGTNMIITEGNNKIILEPVNRKFIENGFGIHKGKKSLLKALMKEKEFDKKIENEKYKLRQSRLK